MEEDDVPSLRHRLVNWLFTPLYLWLLFSTATGYLAAVNLANRPYDLVLLERAKLLASRYSHGQGTPSFDLAQLFPDAEGGFLFALYDSQGHRLAGSGHLPAPLPRTSAPRPRPCATPRSRTASCACSPCTRPAATATRCWYRRRSRCRRAWTWGAASSATS